MRRWIALLILLSTAAAIGLVEWNGGGPSDSAVAQADRQLQACVESAPRPPVGGPDASIRCLHEVGSDLPRCTPSAASPITGVRLTGLREAVTTDDGHGGRCVIVLPREPGIDTAGCPQADLLLHIAGLAAKRFTSRRCPRIGRLRHQVAGLRSGRTGLIEIENRSNVILDLAPDGVPVGGGFRHLPPRGGHPVPALSSHPGAAPCGSTPGQGRLATAHILIDVPEPRCLPMGTDQGLRIVNDLRRYGGPSRAITVRFIGYHARVGPGEAAVFPRPLGTYAAPGLHQVTTSYHGNGPEVMLVRGSP